MGKFDLLKSQSQNYDNASYVGSQTYLHADIVKSRRVKTRFILIGAALLVIVAVAIGLGVGLNQSSDTSDDNKAGDKQEQEGGDQSTTTIETTISSYTTSSTPSPSSSAPRVTTTRTSESSTNGQSETTTVTAAKTTSTADQTSPTSQSTTSSILTTKPSPTSSSTVTTSSTTPSNSPPSTTEAADWLSSPCTDQSNPPQCPWSNNPLLLISLDGFRAEYLLRNITPVIEKLRTCGVHTPYMRSVYPTLTFPNHYSIVTGLYPESHGIVGNNMYDARINASFYIGAKETENPEWYGGEPIWITAHKQGKKTAGYFWVGTDVNISGIQPDIWKKYDGSIPYEDRVDEILGWLSMGDERPDLNILYMDEPDHAGHGYGPDSTQVDAMLAKMDNVIKRLMNGLLQRNMDHCVNVVILADHGMTPTSCERQVSLNKYYKNVDDLLIFSGTTGHISTRYRKEDNIVYENEDVVPTQDILDALECKSSHLNVFDRNTIPVRHHYSNNNRIGDVILDIEDEWLFGPKKMTRCLAGNHGYDNIYKSMHAMFLAHGPNFRQNLQTGPFENIELYNMMADILNITAAPNNGTAGSLRHMLHDVPLSQHDMSDVVPTDCLMMANSSENLENVTSIFPFGYPRMDDASTTCRMSTDEQFISYYDTEYSMSKLTAFILTSSQIPLGNKTRPGCSNTSRSYPLCLEYTNAEEGLSHVYLYDPGFEGDINIETIQANIVPMYDGFKSGIWDFLWRVSMEYTTLYDHIHVTVGPVFDYNSDGLEDKIENNTRVRTVSNSSTVPVPTHYYMVLMKCSTGTQDLSSCSDGDLDILSFVLPHQSNISNCLPNRMFLMNNMARLRDIELLTSQRFLSNFDLSTSARLRTYLPLELWSSPLVAPWVDTPCPTYADNACPSGNVPLLLISLDGFRADYLERQLTPTIKRLSECGVHTPYMRSVYPTVTFPNHYSIVTGLYPESHGIISNSMYDEEIDKIFSLSGATAKDPRWWKGEPLWITAKNQGLKTATYFWPGSDVNISGQYPDIWKKYDGQAGYSQRVYDVLDWLTMPEHTRPDFITLYFDEPDHAGHADGPVSEGVNGQLETVDELINILMTNLYEKNLQNCVNMIIIADHGMSDQTCAKTVVMKNYYPDIVNMLTFDRVMGQVFPQFAKDKGREAHRQNETHPVPDIVDALMCKESAMKVFTKDTLPIRHHYTNNERIGKVILDMEDAWLVFSKSAYFCEGGNHGWDNTYKNMHALFLAHGPAFKVNFTAQPFENIELYNLMSEILGIEPSRNNGTIGSLHYILQNATNLTETTNDNNMFEKCELTSEHNLTAMCGCEQTKIVQSSDVFLNNDGGNQLFGEPLLFKNDSVCILHQKGSTAAYSNYFRAPIWVTSVVSNESMNSNKTQCVNKDIRIDKTTTDCYVESVNITWISLDMKGVELAEGALVLSSSLVPVYSGFKTGIWQFVLDLLTDYTSLYGTLSITMGPVYNYNNDGLWEGINNKTKFTATEDPVPIPTHIYVIIVKCKNTKDVLCLGDGVDTLSFVLPNTQVVPNCLKSHVYIKDNAARIRDIELLTGVQFMTAYDTSTAARLRTYLSVDLWPSTLIIDWMDLPCPHQDQCTSDYRPLVLISLDGFRADYLLRNVTPTISRLRQCGVHAPYMRSVYPTKTFPNHYSIATGLYPESHGIIDNNMYDKDIGERFYLGSNTSFDKRWWGGDPIWLTAKRQGLKTATYFWPGSDVDVNGMRPDIWKKYDGSVSYTSRVKEVLSWMAPGGKRPDFITLYFDQPDLAGHKYGPSGEKEIAAALDRVDDSMHDLLNGLMDIELHSCVNLVVIADHGMADVTCDNVVRLNKYIDYNATYVWEGAFGRIANTYLYNFTTKDISPADDPISTDGIVANLTCASPHMNVYRKSTLPVRHHYSNNDRIDDIMLDMESEWLVTRSYISRCFGGNHGYDNIDKSMEALFLAYGPAFKWNLTIDAFENIELYNLFADILNITHSPNNGTNGALNHILKTPIEILENDETFIYENATLAFTTEDDYLDYVQSMQCNKDVNDTSGAFCSGTAQTLRDTFQTLQHDNTPPSRHLPFGLLQLVHNTNSNIPGTALIVQPELAALYSNDLQTTLWISQTLNKTQDTQTIVDCILLDPYIHWSDTDRYCNTPDFRWSSLIVNDSPDVDVTFYLRHFSTVYSNMRKTFYENIWEPLQILVRSWVTKYSQVNVITGPVYDHDHNSLPDEKATIRNNSIPSHYFLVATRCEDTVDLIGCKKYKTVSYIFPHIDNIHVCKTFDDYVLNHEARVRDVELITGFRFFTDLPFHTAVQVRTALPEGLWT